VFLKRVLIVFLGSLFFFASCKKQPISKVEVAPRAADLQSQFERSHNAVFSDTLTVLAAKELQSWNSYFLFSRFVKEYFSTVSASQALELSQDLLEGVAQMKDSLKLSVLKTKSMYARIHVLYSEAYRLNDMAEISSIKPEEVQLQTAKIIAAFNALNSKINSVYSRKIFDEDLRFDESLFEVYPQKEELYSPKKQRKYPLNRGTSKKRR
tara:strand:- start:8456 stop:9085 length:630 start_codon:yes stop_codon:yes gene_type:complete